MASASKSDANATMNGSKPQRPTLLLLMMRFTLGYQNAILVIHYNCSELGHGLEQLLELLVERRCSLQQYKGGAREALQRDATPPDLQPQARRRSASQRERDGRAGGRWRLRPESAGGERWWALGTRLRHRKQQHVWSFSKAAVSKPTWELALDWFFSHQYYLMFPIHYFVFILFLLF